MGLFNGDTRSLDYSSYRVSRPELGIAFGGPHHKDYGYLGCLSWVPHIVGKNTVCIYIYTYTQSAPYRRRPQF